MLEKNLDYIILFVYCNLPLLLYLGFIMCSIVPLVKLITIADSRNLKLVRRINGKSDLSLCPRNLMLMKFLFGNLQNFIKNLS